MTDFRPAMPLGWPVAALAGFMLLAGCRTDRLSGTTGSIEPVAVAAVGHAPADSSGMAKPIDLPADMSGRWQLLRPGAASCSLSFAGASGAVEGTVAPEGGCPGYFFTTRSWAFEGGSLLIRNHNGALLAKLAQTSPGRFEGQSMLNDLVSLTR